MHLYDCRFGTFIPQATSGEIADILRRRFSERLDQNPSPSEVLSWRNSLGAFADALCTRRMDDAWAVLEYQLPLASSRIDCMILGSDQRAAKNAVLIELKQWDRCGVSDVPETVLVGGIEMTHPSAQVRNYREYLEDTHRAVTEQQIHLSSCAFLHNMRPGAQSSVLDARYAALLGDSPLYTAAAADELAEFVARQTQGGAPEDLVHGVLTGSYRPSKKLLDFGAVYRRLRAVDPAGRATASLQQGNGRG
jgi:hypothetical protein